MNLKDPSLNPATVDEVMSNPTSTVVDPVAVEAVDEVTIEIGGVTLTAGELVEKIYSSLIGDACVKGDMLRDTVNRVVAASKHNANLMEALADGADFRIAFRKKGETDWTRVRPKDEASLQAQAMREVTTRQAGVLKNLADVLGVDEFTISNI
jgi:hypothetical protein